MSAVPVHAERRRGARGARGAEAARQLYERHRQRIFAYCLSRLRNRQEAEDAVQNTFLYACSQLGRGVVPENELAWLFTIAHNVCRSRRRSLWRRGRVETTTDPDTLAESAPASGFVRGDELVGLRVALASMPDSQRQALLLREWQGLSYAEIADRLTLSQSAVETLLFRARRNLADRLGSAAEKVAVVLYVPALLQLARRIAGSGLKAKTATAAAMVAGVAAGAGVPLEHALHRHAAATAQRVGNQPRVTAAAVQRVATTKVLPRRVAGVAHITTQTGTSTPTKTDAAATVDTPVQPTSLAHQDRAPAKTNPSATGQALAPATTTASADNQVQKLLGLAGQPPVQLPALSSLPVDLPQLPSLPSLPSLPQLPLLTQLSPILGSLGSTTPSGAASLPSSTPPAQASATTSAQDGSSAGSTTTGVTLPSLSLLP